MWSKSPGGTGKLHSLCLPLALQVRIQSPSGQPLPLSAHWIQGMAWYFIGQRCAIVPLGKVGAEKLSVTKSAGASAKWLK